MKKLLLNLCALFLLPPGVAFGQGKVVKVPIPANDHNPEVQTLEPTKHGYNLTELQKARLDAARQEIFRWQDKMNDALGRFSAICTGAQAENNWPAVQCSLTDLSVTAQPEIPQNGKVVVSPSALPGKQ